MDWSVVTGVDAQILNSFVLLGVVFFLSAFGFLIGKKFKRRVVQVVESIPEPSSVSSKPRFRKRDKFIYYGRKMLRKVSSVQEKVKSISQEVRESSKPGRKRKALLKIARKLLHLKSENGTTQLKNMEPPAEYLQEELEINESQLPSEVLYMLQSLRIFGHFRKPVFLEIVKQMEPVDLLPGQFLFKTGDPDEFLYVLQEGKLDVYVTEPDGSQMVVKVVKPGDTVTSLLSFIDVLTHEPSVFKTVSARACESSIVLRLPLTAFQDVFRRHPESLVRVVQIVMVRLQRVTFLALHQYLGLSSELVKSHGAMRQHSQSLNPNYASPIRLKLRELAHAKYSDGELKPLPLLLEGRPDVVEAGGIGSSLSTPPRPRRETSFGYSEPIDMSKATELGLAGFTKILGLDSEDYLRGKIEVRELSGGSYIMKEDTQKDAALVYVITGCLSVSQKVTGKEEDANMFVAHPGELVGGLAVLTGEPSFFTVRSKHTAIVGMMSKDTFYGIMREKPEVVLFISRTVVSRLSPFVRQIDFALDWHFIESGRALYRQDDESDSTYIVLSGRLRSVAAHSDGKKELVGEYGRGDLVGIVECLTQTSRSTTVMAVRDTELARLHDGLLNYIKLKYPNVVSRLINLLGHRILGSWKSSLGTRIEQRPSLCNFTTVAVVPASDDVPLLQFSYEMYHSLTAIGPALLLTSEVVKGDLGHAILDTVNEYRLSTWLAQQEDQHRIVIYQCDTDLTPWSKRCIRQADCILIIGMAEAEPSVGKIETKLENIAIRTQKELVLLHKEPEKGGPAPRPRNTAAWLNIRSWCSSHHHILAPRRMFQLQGKSIHKVHEQYRKVLVSQPDLHSDFSRLARWLTGESVGLVLGGGGARGAAHVGMIQALREVGIPIDMVGGVSIGAFMGALWCMERDIDRVKAKAKGWSMKMTQLWRQLLDLTYPVTSMFSGKCFNAFISEVFGEIQIEDLWLPYFTVTTDITSSQMRIHTHGCLWRYVRSSMSVVSLLPPLCDPIDGHYLVDGCYINNVPADVMRSRGAKHILAIDVGSQEDTDHTNYGDSLSGWWVLWKKWWPFTTPAKVLNLPDIQSRLAYVSCVRQLEEVKNSDYCEYIRPPIDKYKTLQFGSFDDILEVGYHHGKTYFIGRNRGGVAFPWSHSSDSLKSVGGSSPLLQKYQVWKDPSKSTQQTPALASFTDLAQMIASVKKPAVDFDSDTESSDTDTELNIGKDLSGSDEYLSDPSGLFDEQERMKDLDTYIRRRGMSVCPPEELEDLGL